MRLFVERPIATAMVFLVLMVLGVFSFFNIPIEMAQSQDFPELNINTSWYGVAPEIMQTEVTAPLEEKVATVKDVRKITSSSSIGNSRITLEFDKKTNMEFVRLALREKISEVRENLPYDVIPRIRFFV
ncbi:MAG: efflux RND transporter permease subunit, partial [Candidatus Aminicenantaceae bacterium]